MRPFRDPPLGLGTPGIRRVGRRLYLSDGQFMYNTALAGMRLHCIPDEDVSALDQRTGRIEIGALCLAFAVLGGVAVSAWSPWWFVPALVAAAVAPPVLVGRGVSERYPAVANPAVVLAARGRVSMDRPPLGAAVAMMLLNLPALFRVSHGKRVWVAFAIGALLVDLVRMLVDARERKALREESTAS